MRDGIISVGLNWVCMLRIRSADYCTVHAEPGEDKITFANDVANWILTKTRTAASRDSAEGRSKL